MNKKAIKKGFDINIQPFFTMFNYFTASFNSFPALKAGAFEAAICISSPVCGLRPVRAVLSRTSNVPKPRICTFSPFANAFVIVSNTACVAASATIS